MGAGGMSIPGMQTIGMGPMSVPGNFIRYNFSFAFNYYTNIIILLILFGFKTHSSF